MDHDASTKVLVVVNPHGGRGVAAAIAESRILPILIDAGLRHDVIHTDHPGHAIELGTAFNPLEHRGVLFVSGDGTAQEFVSGLLGRCVREAVGKGCAGQCAPRPVPPPPVCRNMPVQPRLANGGAVSPCGGGARGDVPSPSSSPPPARRAVGA
jgi:hypothetical protein